MSEFINKKNDDDDKSNDSPFFLSCWINSLTKHAINLLLHVNTVRKMNDLKEL